MPFPTSGWPPRPASGVRSIRFFVSGTATANWSDNAYLFIDDAGANTYEPMPYVAPGSTTPVQVGTRTSPGTPMGGGSDPRDVLPGDTLGHVKAQIWANNIRICNDGGADLEFSFAVTDDMGAGALPVQGVLKPNEQVSYRNRYEAGIALRGAGAFRVEAW